MYEKKKNPIAHLGWLGLIGVGNLYQRFVDEGVYSVFCVLYEMHKEKKLSGDELC